MLNITVDKYYSNTDVADFKEAPRLPTLKELVGFPLNEQTANFRLNLVPEDGEDSRKSRGKSEKVGELSEEETGLSFKPKKSSDPSEGTFEYRTRRKGIREKFQRLNEEETDLTFKADEPDESSKKSSEHSVEKDENSGEDLPPRKSRKHYEQRIRINDIGDKGLRRRKSRVNYARSLDADVKPTTMRGVPLEILTAKAVLRGFYVTKGEIERVETTTRTNSEDLATLIDFSTTAYSDSETTTAGIMTASEASAENLIVTVSDATNVSDSTTENMSGNLNGTQSETTESVDPTISSMESSTVGAPINESPGDDFDDAKKTTIALVSESGKESEEDSYASGSSVMSSAATTTIPKTTMSLTETTEKGQNLRVTDSLGASSTLRRKESANYTESMTQSTVPSTTQTSIQSTFASRGRNRGRIRSRTRSTTSSYIDEQGIDHTSTPRSRSRGRNHRRTTTSSSKESVEVLNYPTTVEIVRSPDSTTETSKVTKIVQSVTTEYIHATDVSSVLTTSAPVSIPESTSVAQKTMLALNDDSTTTSSDVTNYTKIISTVYPENVDSSENDASTEFDEHSDLTTLGIGNIPSETIPVSVETTPISVTLEEDTKTSALDLANEKVQSSSQSTNVPEATTEGVILPETAEPEPNKETTPAITISVTKEIVHQTTELPIKSTKTSETTETISQEEIISKQTPEKRIYSELSESTAEETTINLDPTEPATTAEIIIEPTEPTTTPKRVNTLNPSRLKQSRRRQKIRLNQASHDFGRKPSRRGDIQRRVTHRKYGQTSLERETTGQFNIRRRGSIVFRGRRPNVSSITTSKPQDERIDSTESFASGEERKNVEETKRRNGRRKIVVKRVRTKNDEEESEEEKDQEEQETSEFPAVEPLPAHVERGVDEVNLSKNTGLPTRKPGSLLANRLRKPAAGTQTTSKLPSTVAGHRKVRPSETTLPTFNVEDDLLSSQTEAPKPGREADEKPEVDQSSRAQELAVTVADPPPSSSSSLSSSQGSSDTGRGALIRDSLRRRISTTIAPRTTTVRPVRNRQKPLKDRIVENSTARPRRPPVVDYDYYEDEEEPIVGKSTFNGKLFLTSKGTIRCLDQGNFPHPSSCKKFITCARMVNGQVIGAEYTCPDKLSFDPVGGLCNWSAGLGCKE